MDKSLISPTGIRLPNIKKRTEVILPLQVNPKPIAQWKLIKVGHGDASIVNMMGGCKYDSHNLMIDCGSGTRDVFHECDYNKETIVSISHSHTDHLGGFKHAGQRSNSYPADLWLPAYWDEFIKILHLITQMKGVQKLPVGQEHKIAADLRIAQSEALALHTKVGKIKVRALYDGVKLCHHLKCLNPPLDPYKIANISHRKVDNFLTSVRGENFSQIGRWFNEDSVEYIYARSILEGARPELALPITEVFPSSEDQQQENRTILMRAFFAKYSGLFDRLSERATPRTFSSIMRSIKLSSNNASLVLRFNNVQKELLFTGDAGKRVFRRLIKNKEPLNAYAIKMPHHGSYSNINASILSYIHPEIAVISHGNRKFGSGWLPSIKTINLLKHQNIERRYTEDLNHSGQYEIAWPSNLPWISLK